LREILCVGCVEKAYIDAPRHAWTHSEEKTLLFEWLAKKLTITEQKPYVLAWIWNVTHRLMSNAQSPFGASVLESLEMFRNRASEIKGVHVSEDIDCKLQHCDQKKKKKPYRHTCRSYRWPPSLSCWGHVGLICLQGSVDTHITNGTIACLVLVQSHRGDQSTNGQEEPVVEADPRGQCSKLSTGKTKLLWL
jgi:hypothetical protein